MHTIGKFTLWMDYLKFSYDALSTAGCWRKVLAIELNPFPKKPWFFTWLQYKPFENTVGKGEIACNEQFLLFPHCFLPVWRTFCWFLQIWICRLHALWKSLKFFVWERVKWRAIGLTFPQTVVSMIHNSRIVVTLLEDCEQSSSINTQNWQENKVFANDNNITIRQNLSLVQTEAYAGGKLNAIPPFH